MRKLGHAVVITFETTELSFLSVDSIALFKNYMIMKFFSIFSMQQFRIHYNTCLEVVKKFHARTPYGFESIVHDLVSETAADMNGFSGVDRSCISRVFFVVNKSVAFCAYK